MKKTEPDTLLALLAAEPLPGGHDVPAELWERVLLAPARDLFSRPGKGLRVRLVEAGWRLGGGVGTCPAPVPHLVEILHAGSLVVDDIEDGSTHRRGQPALHRRYGVPCALNLGNWLYFWPQRLVGRLALPADVELELHRRITDTLYHCHLGQGLDLGADVAAMSPAELPGLVETVTRLKTGALTELAMTLGAIVALARPARVEQLASFGHEVGVALQMLDDLGNLVGHQDPHKQYEDLRLGRVTWPWAWLAEVLDEDRFRALQQRARDLAANPTDAPALAADMARLLRDHGQRAARARLCAAAARLRDAVDTAADPLIEELMHLEKRYVAAG